MNTTHVCTLLMRGALIECMLFVAEAFCHGAHFWCDWKVGVTNVRDKAPRNSWRAVDARCDGVGALEHGLCLVFLVLSHMNQCNFSFWLFVRHATSVNPEKIDFKFNLGEFIVEEHFFSRNRDSMSCEVQEVASGPTDWPIFALVAHWILS